MQPLPMASLGQAELQTGPVHALSVSTKKLFLPWVLISREPTAAPPSSQDSSLPAASQCTALLGAHAGQLSLSLKLGETLQRG